jgi:S1-C subfamily serine protease/HEAT repeat protein
MPLPRPVLHEDSRATGLTIVQKLCFGAITASILAGGGFFGIRAWLANRAEPDNPDKTVAVASNKPPPVEERPALPKAKPATAPTPPVQSKANDESPTESLPVEEDTGQKPAPPRTTGPSKSEPPKVNALPPPVTDVAPKSAPPKSERPPKTDPPASESPPKENSSAEARDEPNPPPEIYRSGAKVYERLLKSTVMVLRIDTARGKAARGTGSFIDREHKLILTNYHVVGDESEVWVTFPIYERGKLIVESDQYLRKFKEKEFIRGKVVKVLKGQDLALVEMEKVPAGAPVLRPASRSARPGDVVHSIGNPGASDAAWNYTKGEVRAVYPKTWDGHGGDSVMRFEANVLETTSPTNPGDSGGPLVNEFVQLVGVTQGANTKARGVSLFIDVSEVRKILKEHGVSTDSVADAAAGTPDNPAAEAIAKGLNDADPKARAQAATRLSDLGPDAKVVLHALMRALGDDDKNVRKQAGNALLQIGIPERGDVNSQDVPYLRACLRDDAASGELQRYAIKTLMVLGADARSAAAEIGKAARSDDKETRQTALAALDKLGPAARKAGPDLAQLLKVEDRFVSARAALVLLKVDDVLESAEAKAAVSVLINLQKPQSEEDLTNKQLIALATEASKALIQLGKPAVPAIRKALTTEFKGGNRATGEDVTHAIARLAMIRILEAMGSNVYSAELDRELATLQQRDPAVAVREGAKQARGKIRPGK